MKITNDKIKKKIMKDGRPIFYYNNDDSCEIKAGGLLYYRYNKKIDDIEFLMIKCNGKYEDFGGKTDQIDICIEETVAREAEEESNNIFVKQDILKSIQNCKVVYTKGSKYIIYLIKTNINYNENDFGEKEIYENIPRTVEWIKLSDLLDSKFIKNKLHVRLKHRYFFNTINKIKSENINMFVD